MKSKTVFFQAELTFQVLSTRKILKGWYSSFFQEIGVSETSTLQATCENAGYRGCCGSLRSSRICRADVLKGRTNSAWCVPGSAVRITTHRLEKGIPTPSSGVSLGGHRLLHTRSQGFRLFSDAGQNDLSLPFLGHSRSQQSL